MITEELHLVLSEAIKDECVHIIRASISFVLNSSCD